MTTRRHRKWWTATQPCAEPLLATPSSVLPLDRASRLLLRLRTSPDAIAASRIRSQKRLTVCHVLVRVQQMLGGAVGSGGAAALPTEFPYKIPHSKTAAEIMQLGVIDPLLSDTADGVLPIGYWFAAKLGMGRVRAGPQTAGKDAFPDL